MNCAYHPEIEGSAACSACAKQLCAACSHQIRERTFCQDCLIQGADYASRSHGAQDAGPSPQRAALLAIVPALGAIYNGQYLKALTHFAVFASLSYFSEELHGGVFGLATFVFYCFMIFDAYGSAQRIRQQRLDGTLAGDRLVPTYNENSPFWGILLIALGVLFFFHNLNLLDLEFLRQLWPLLFLGLGVYLVYRWWKDRAARSASVTGWGTEN